MRLMSFFWIIAGTPIGIRQQLYFHLDLHSVGNYVGLLLEHLLEFVNSSISIWTFVVWGIMLDYCWNTCWNSSTAQFPSGPLQCGELCWIIAGTLIGIRQQLYFHLDLHSVGNYVGLLLEHLLDFVNSSISIWTFVVWGIMLDYC